MLGQTTPNRLKMTIILSEGTPQLNPRPQSIDLISPPTPINITPFTNYNPGMNNKSSNLHDSQNYPWNYSSANSSDPTLGPKRQKLPKFKIDNSSFYTSKSSITGPSNSFTTPVLSLALSDSHKNSNYSKTKSMNDIQSHREYDDMPKKRKLVRKADLKSRDIIDIRNSNDNLCTSDPMKAIVIDLVDVDYTPQSLSRPNTQLETESHPKAVAQERQIPIVIHDSPQKTILSVVERDCLQFLNTEPASGLIQTLKCTDDQARSIIDTRPITEIQSLIKSDRLIIKLIQKYMDILTEIRSVDDLVSHCDTVGQEIRMNTDRWDEIIASGDHTSTFIDLETSLKSDSSKVLNTGLLDCEYQILTTQPDFINQKASLKQYQLIGISWMMMLYKMNLGGILADEMGLGKSAQVVGFIGLLNSQSQSGSGINLIVVPSSTLDNWMREIKHWCPKLNAISYSGLIDERRHLQYEITNDDKLDIIVTTYTIATGNSEDRRFIRRLECKTLFLDEGHMIKNGQSLRAKHLKGFKIPFKMLVTGTPIQNNLIQLLSLLVFINPQLFEGAQHSFEAIFDKNNNAAKDGLDHDVARRRIDHAAKIMTPFVLRRKKDEVRKDIPPKTRIVEYCKFSHAQKQVYHDIMMISKKEYLAAAKESNQKVKSKGKVIKTAVSGLSNVLMQLRKVACHQLLQRKIYNDEMLPNIGKSLLNELEFMDSNLEYVIEDLSVMSDFQIHQLCLQYPRTLKYQLSESDWMDSAKIIVLKRMVLEMRDRGDRILLFSQFVIMLDILETVLETIGVTFLRLDGSTPGSERMALIDEYNQTPAVTVFLLSTKACGLGINLTSANTVILYDIDFNPHNDIQAEDRAHRVGQTKAVTVYKIIIENTVEQHMLNSSNVKLLLDLKVQDIDEKAEERQSQAKILEMLRDDVLLVSDTTGVIDDVL